jgi:succinate dehydrogenase/fumarate reductase flavoprotein subunit
MSITCDTEADVVVVGSGATALSAASTASIRESPHADRQEDDFAGRDDSAADARAYAAITATTSSRQRGSRRFAEATRGDGRAAT